MIAKIPKSKILKMAIYVNTEKKTMVQIKKELGCQYILNAGLYVLGTREPSNMLIVDGKVLCPKGNPFGYAIHGATMQFSYNNLVKAPTFISAYPVLVRDGRATGDRAGKDQDGFKMRSAVGLTMDGDVVLLCDRSARSLAGIAGDMIDQGCETAINFDGGESASCDFNGKALISSRACHNYFVLWTQPEQEDKPTGSTAATVKRKKMLLIAGHGAGDPGAVSQLNGRSWQEAQEARTLVPLIAAALKPCVDVTIYDTGRNAYYDYKAGTLAAAAKFASYDYVLEVHFNAHTKDAGDGKRKGSEIYVTTAEKGVTVEEKILEQLKALGFPNRGVKRKNFAVINKAKSSGTSSALLEICFIDDADDMAIYAKNRQAVANAVAAGILEGFGIQTATQSAAESHWRTVQEKAGLNDATMEYLAAYQYGGDLLRKLAAAML